MIRLLWKFHRYIYNSRDKFANPKVEFILLLFLLWKYFKFYLQLEFISIRRTKWFNNLTTTGKKCEHILWLYSRNGNCDGKIKMVEPFSDFKVHFWYCDEMRIHNFEIYQWKNVEWFLSIRSRNIRKKKLWMTDTIQSLHSSLLLKTSENKRYEYSRYEKNSLFAHTKLLWFEQHIIYFGWNV